VTLTGLVTLCKELNLWLGWPSEPERDISSRYSKGQIIILD
jgi:hypothetical protein